MISQSSGNKKIAKNTIALYIRMGITMLISFFATRITLEILGVEDYGLNNVVASVVSMFGFINGSLGTAVQRFFSIEIGKKNHEMLARVFGTSLFLHTLVAGVTFLLLELFAFFFLSKLSIPPDRLWAAHFVFQTSIVSLVLNILSVPHQALLKAREEYSKIAVLDVLRAVFSLASLILLYRIQYDKLVALSLLNLVVTFFYISAFVVYARKYIEASFRLYIDKELIQEMLSFISMLIFTVLASVLNKQGIVVLVNLFFGLTLNAAYAVAFQVSNMLDSFAMNFKQAVVPQLMQAYGANDLTRMNKLMFLGTKVTFLLMMFISIPLIVETDYILKTWLKEPPEYAYVFTFLIVIGVNINTFYYFVYQSVHASGRIKMQQILISLSYILSVTVIFVSFKVGANFYYAVIIPIFFSIIRNVIVIYSAIKTINLKAFNYFSQVVLPCIVLVLVIIPFQLVVKLLLESSFIRLVLVLSANSIFVTVIGYLLVLNREDRAVLAGLFMKLNK